MPCKINQVYNIIMGFYALLCILPLFLLPAEEIKEEAKKFRRYTLGLESKTCRQHVKVWLAHVTTCTLSSLLMINAYSGGWFLLLSSYSS